MKKAYKIEIIIESVYLPQIIKIFEALALPGYTIINGVAGRGSHGVHDAPGLSDVSANSYIVIICSESETEKSTTAMRKELAKYGGICFVSEVSLLLTAKKL